MHLLINIISIFIVMGLAFLFSTNKKAVKIKSIAIALFVQVLVALFFVKVPLGREWLLVASNGVDHVIGYGNTGLQFVFGSLADSKAATGFLFFFQVLAIITFTSGLISALFYLGILGFIIKLIGGGIGKIMGTSKAETFVAVSNIFLGQTEAPILVRHYIGKMTKSEIFVLLVAGMGSVSGAVLVGYSLMGVPMDSLLLACSMVPLSALIVAKLLVPEEETPDQNILDLDRKAGNSNILEAISTGAIDGFKIAIAVGASLVAIVGIVALINGLLGLAGLSLERILGWVFTPFAFMMGIQHSDVPLVAQLLGLKIALNEFVAFSKFGAGIKDALSPRAAKMVAIALMGFANISSTAICISGISVLAPEKRKIISGLAFKGMIGGATATFLSALIVGLFL